MTPERIAAIIARHGQPVTLQRITGPSSQVRFEVVCQAIVRRYESHELISGSGIVQGDRSVIITNAEIARAQWPGPPRTSDKCMIDRKQTVIQASDLRRLRNDIVLYLIQVRG